LLQATSVQGENDLPSTLAGVLAATSAKVLTWTFANVAIQQARKITVSLPQKLLVHANTSAGTGAQWSHQNQREHRCIVAGVACVVTGTTDIAAVEQVVLHYVKECL
jgi:hypothetical protein